MTAGRNPADLITAVLTATLGTTALLALALTPAVDCGMLRNHIDAARHNAAAGNPAAHATMSRLVTVYLDHGCGR